MRAPATVVVMSVAMLIMIGSSFLRCLLSGWSRPGLLRLDLRQALVSSRVHEEYASLKVGRK
jgi:hypothetical protein